MSKQETLLAILELDCVPSRLIERAAWLADVFECGVHLVLFEPDSGAFLGGFSVSNEAEVIREELFRAQAAIVDEYATQIRNTGVEVTTEVLQTRPLNDGILEIAEKIQPKFVVKATDYHSASERSTLVDTDWQLMRACPYPLWIVRSESMPERPFIVAAVDPGNAHDKPAELDREIIRNARAVAEATGGDLHLLHTYQRLTGIGTAANRALTASKLPIDAIDAKIKAAHRSALDALAGDCGVAAERTHQLPGRTHEILPAFTRSHAAGLVVIGSLARWGIKRMIIGSTAERVVDHLACDILIVRHAEG